MASLFQGLPRPVLLSGPHSYKRPLHPAADATPCETTRDRRIAHWDHKREACGNCKLIFLKTQSRVAGFCSVDCKTNAAYMAKIRQRAYEATREPQHNDVEEEVVVHEEPVALAATFGSFGLEERTESEFCHVKTMAASALY